MVAEALENRAATKLSSMEENLVLSEGDALEVLAYLVTAARTQAEEPAEYGPMRLLTAANQLATLMAQRGSPPVREFLARLQTLPVTATPTADRSAYIARLDEICVALADCLVATAGKEEDRP